MIIAKIKRLFSEYFGKRPWRVTAIDLTTETRIKEDFMTENEARAFACELENYPTDYRDVQVFNNSLN